MKNKGFSLVELIVVIAIMAILVGVAVPVYTSYIEKAQKSKDEQMVGEIKHAIEIAAVGDNWASTLTPGVVGTIVITSESMTVNDETTAKLLEKAINDTFGANNSMKLAYDGWTGTLNADDMSVIVNSSFYGNVPTLMGDIQYLTNSLRDFVTTDIGEDALGDNFKGWMETNNINLDDKQEVANAATLYIAQNMTSLSNAEDQTAKNALLDLWKAPNIGNLMGGSVTGASRLSMVAAEYARAEAIINYMNCEEARAAFVKNSVGGATLPEILTSIQAIMGEVNAHVASGCENGCAAKLNTYFTDGTAENDAKAYFALMGQVDASSEVVLENIGNESLYSGDTLTSYVNSYVSVADLMQNANAEDGDIVIVVAMNATGTLTINVYPLEYTK